jgi:hypothetical protein
MAKRSFLKSPLIIIAVVSIFSPLVSAKTSVADFETMTKDERAKLVVNIVDDTIAQVKQVKPELAQKIDDYFYKKQPGKELTDGFSDFYGEILAIKDLAKEGKLDLKNIMVEGVVVDVILTKFPPPPNPPATQPSK